MGRAVPDSQGCRDLTTPSPLDSGYCYSVKRCLRG
nr:MAG TPA: Neuraxin and MAP1B repeat [Caudoviricetes sp.]